MIYRIRHKIPFHTKDTIKRPKIFTEKGKEIVIRQIHGSMSAAADNGMQAPILVAMSHDMPDRQYTIQGY